MHIIISAECLFRIEVTHILRAAPDLTQNIVKCNHFKKKRSTDINIFIHDKYCLLSESTSWNISNRSRSLLSYTVTMWPFYSSAPLWIKGIHCE